MRQHRLIWDIFNVFSKVDTIKKDPEMRARSVRFAISAIIYSLLMVACAVGGAFLFKASPDAGLLYIFALVIAITLLLGTLIELVGALLRVIAQFMLNKQPLSWVALAVFLLCVAASVIAVVVILLL